MKFHLTFGDAAHVKAIIYFNSKSFFDSNDEELGCRNYVSRFIYSFAEKLHSHSSQHKIHVHYLFEMKNEWTAQKKAFV